MKILLLGATGYLGSNIVKALADENHSTICVVRNSSDTKRIEPFCKNFISSDVESVEIFLKHNQIDWIINSVCTYQSNDSLYADLLISNIIFPLNVLNLAVKYNIGGFLSIGTSLPEGFNHYSFSKHELARFGRFLSEKDGISFLELQLEMFYGGDFVPDGRFINSIRSKLRLGEDIPLTEGNQKRDIIRVEDVVGIIKKLIVSDYAKGYKSLPVGTGENHSIKEIVSYMKNIIGSESKLKFGEIPTRVGEPDTLADIEWYKKIDYSLKYGYCEGLRDFCLSEL